MPPLGKGALYIRPLLLGSGPLLGLGPAPTYTFVVYAAAVGAYFKVEHEFTALWIAALTVRISRLPSCIPSGTCTFVVTYAAAVGAYSKVWESSDETAFQ